MNACAYPRLPSCARPTSPMIKQRPRCRAMDMYRAGLCGPRGRRSNKAHEWTERRPCRLHGEGPERAERLDGLGKERRRRHGPAIRPDEMLDEPAILRGLGLRHRFGYLRKVLRHAAGAPQECRRAFEQVAEVVRA